MLPNSYSPLREVNSNKEELLEAIGHVIDKGEYILADEVQAFEQEFAEYVGTRYAVGVGSGTDALTLTLQALGIGPGDEVITTAHTALATIAAIVAVGATPVVLDIDPTSYLLDPKHVESAVTSRSKALLVVHLYGQAAPMPTFLAIAQKHQLYVLEDCAQAHGALHQGRHVGTFGIAGCFSFYPTKNLGALGDGGMIVTSHRDLFEKLKCYREYGWNTERISYYPGRVSRLDEIQAAILRIKLKKLDFCNQQRQSIAQFYDTHLQDLPILTPQTLPNSRHVFHLYVIQVEQRQRLQEYLAKYNIHLGVHYQPLVFEHPGYQSLIRVPTEMPVLQHLSSKILSLPMYPGLPILAQERLVSLIRKFRYRRQDSAE